MGAFNFSHAEEGHKRFPPMGGRDTKRVTPVLRGGEGGNATSFKPAISPFCSPPCRN